MTELDERFLVRGKRVDNGEWIEGFYNGEYYNGEQNVSYIFVPLKEAIYGSVCYDVIPNTLGRYTGLKDKNGKMIFEGDICKGCWNKLIQIYYDNCYLQFRAKDNNGYHDSVDYFGRFNNFVMEGLEVIGNIHDNAELLEGKQNA